MKRKKDRDVRVGGKKKNLEDPTGIRECARLAGCAYQTVVNYIHRGMPATKGDDGRWSVRPSDVIAMRAGQRRARKGTGHDSCEVLAGRAEREAERTRRLIEIGAEEASEEPGGDLQVSLLRAKVRKLELDARRAQLDYDLRTKRVVQREELRAGLAKLARILRNALETLQRQHGQDAADIMIAGIQQYERELDAVIATSDEA